MVVDKEDPEIKQYPHVLSHIEQAQAVFFVSKGTALVSHRSVWSFEQYMVKKSRLIQLCFLLIDKTGNNQSLHKPYGALEIPQHFGPSDSFRQNRHFQN